MIHLVAHRGHAAQFPENTLPALESAVSLGLRFLEFDVQLAADEVPVVIHDETLSRTADNPASVFDLPSTELTRIEVNERQRLGERFQGVHIPLLADAVRFLEQHRSVTAFVEIKRASLRRFTTERVVPRVLQAIEPVKARCIIISFDLPALHFARSLGAAIGWVLTNYDDDARRQCDALQPEFLFCNYRKLPPDGSSLWPGPWRWALYEVDDAQLARQLTQRGAHLIETMAAGAMTEALRGVV